MKKGIISILTRTVLLIVFVFGLMLTFFSDIKSEKRLSNGSSGKDKQEIAGKKATILPFIVIGGIQLFRKTFSKK
jgi:hypothetical protein